MSKQCNFYLTTKKLDKEHRKNPEVTEMEVICNCDFHVNSPQVVYLKPEYTASQRKLYPHANHQIYFTKWKENKYAAHL